MDMCMAPSALLPCSSLSALTWGWATLVSSVSAMRTTMTTATLPTLPVRPGPSRVQSSDRGCSCELKQCNELRRATESATDRSDTGTDAETRWWPSNRHFRAIR